MAGATFGDVGMSLSVAGAAFGAMFECRFWWQAQRLAKIWETAGARNVELSYTKCGSKVRKIPLPNGRARDDQVIFGSCSDHVRIMVDSPAIANLTLHVSFIANRSVTFSGRGNMW